jgi:hypothetical protein
MRGPWGIACSWCSDLLLGPNGAPAFFATKDEAWAAAIAAGWDVNISGDYSEHVHTCPKHLERKAAA